MDTKFLIKNLIEYLFHLKIITTPMISVKTITREVVFSIRPT